MFSSFLHSFGLDISDLSAKLVAVKSNFRGERVIHAWGACDFPEGTIVDGEILQSEKAAELLTAMLQGQNLATPYVTASLPESKTFMKVIEVDANENIGASVLEELPNHIPLSLDELIIDWTINETFENRCMVTVGAVPKTVAERYTELLTACGLKPVAFEIEAQAIARAVSPLTVPPPSFRFKLEQLSQSLHRRQGLTEPAPTKPASALDHQRKGEHAQFLVDLGATRSSLIMVDWDTIQFTSSVALSGVDATKQIANRLKLTFDEAERAKRICGLDSKKCKGVVSSVLEGLLNSLAVEIERAIEFYQTHFKRSHQVGSVLLTGGGANLAHAETLLSSQLLVPVHVGDPLMNIFSKEAADTLPKKDALSFTTAIGLALRDTIENR